VKKKFDPEACIPFVGRLSEEKGILNFTDQDRMQETFPRAHLKSQPGAPKCNKKTLPY
jgi:hypothetical protein